MNTRSSIVNRPSDRGLTRSTPGVALTAILLLGAGMIARGEISPGQAFEAYRQGNFQKSQEQYSQLAKERPDDPRLRFNAGAAAYRLNDLTNATTLFESVLGNPDLRLQQQAYYNLGNTRYRLGEALPDHEARRRLWSEALTNFVSAIKLDQSDTNAAANYSYVRQQLEQLERQLPPPQPQSQQGQQQKNQQKDRKPSDSQQDSPSEDSSDPQDSQDNKSQQSQSKDQNSRDPSQDNSSENENQGKGSGESQNGDPSEESQGAKPGEGKQEAQKPGESKSGTGKEGESATTAGAAEEGSGPDGEMTPAQAVQMLENQKGDEKALMFRAYGSGKEAAERAARIRKPW